MERFIGVIYRPDTERWSHYSRCDLAKQFDAFAWFDVTNAVTPVPMRSEEGNGSSSPFGF